MLLTPIHKPHYGRFFLIHTAASCCDTKHPQFVNHLNKCLDGCSTSKCNFVSYSFGQRRCHHCKTCTDILDAGRGPRSGANNTAFISYAKNAFGDHLLVRRSKPIVLHVVALLQDEYSVTLYGAKGRVPIDDLRILWLPLMPRAAIKLLARIGVCGWHAEPPNRPFYLFHDLRNNPRAAVWIRKQLPVKSAPNHSWVEVTHCSRRGHASARWHYVAPGSGVSVNVGRTLVVESVAVAKKLLLEAELDGPCGRLPPECPEARTCCGEPLHASSCYSPVVNITGSVGPLNSSRIANLDSLQVLDNMDSYAGERRHELILLRFSECEPLTHRTRGVMCGAYPNLLRCNPENKALSMLQQCTWSAHAATHAQPYFNTSTVQRDLSVQRWRNKCNSTHCYGGAGTFYCMYAS